VFYRFLLLVPIFFCFFCWQDTQAAKNQDDKALQQVIDFEDVLNEETPLQFSQRCMKDYFEQKANPCLSLQSRQSGFNSKTSAFNSAFIKYVKNAYNNPTYSDVLSQDSTDIVQFLELSNELNLGIDTVYVGVRLFYNKMKGCELIDDTVVIPVLTALPQFFDKFYSFQDIETEKNNLDFIKKNIENIILSRFISSMNQFQTAPDSFVANLAAEITTTLKQEFEKYEKKSIKKEMQERLRHVTIRFLDVALGKMMWNAKSPEGIWHSFIEIANRLQILGAHDIINHMDDLDDLLWSLTHRFCFFLDFTGSTLPLSFYDEIEQDLINKVVFFLEMKEQDEGITTKKELLAESLIRAKTQAIAFVKSGIISQPMINQ